MMGLIAISAFLGLCTAGYLLAPKGGVWHELTRLPVFWWRMVRLAADGMTEKRIAYGVHRRQYFLLWKPEKEKRECKGLIVYFHGGGWRLGAPGYFRRNARVFTGWGYAVVIPSYRRPPRYSYPAIREDLNLFLQELRSITRTEFPSPPPVILGGMSAGGNLAALTLYDHKALRQSGWQPGEFSGLYLLGAPLDLNHMRDSLPLLQFAGKRDSASFQAANPVSYLPTTDTTPVLCIHGEKDGLVEVENAVSFIRKLKASQPGNVRFHYIPGGTHLDCASWPFREEPVRGWLKEWLDQL